MAGRRLTFEVDLVRGKIRHQTDFRHRRQYNPSANRLAAERIRAAYLDALEESGLEVNARGELFGPHVPVCLTVETFRVLPKSRPKSVLFEADTYKPDSDNVDKLVRDALNRLAWHDDAQVTTCHLYKRPRSRYAVGDRTVVTVSDDWDGGTHADLEEKGRNREMRSNG